MRKIPVIFNGGEARDAQRHQYGVNYMICDADGVELYAEVGPEEWDSFDPEDFDAAAFDTWSEDTLKAEIIRQAEEAGIPADALSFD